MFKGIKHPISQKEKEKNNEFMENKDKLWITNYSAILQTQTEASIE